MEFENNWVYPWPDTAYDPVLKVRMSIGGGGREADVDDVSIRIDYDPQIEAGRYTQYLTEKERIGVPSRHADKPRAFWSPESKRITDMPNGIGGSNFPAHNEVHGAVRRIKMYRRYVPANKLGVNAISALENKIAYIKAGNFPVISRNPKDFLLYAFRNYIGIFDLNGINFPPVPNTNIKRIEMSLHSEVMTKFFHLPLQDYDEVEPDWYCISARELNHEFV
jgi:hypothetical protein